MTRTLTAIRPAPAIDPEPSDLFDPFPEPRGWALNWDGPALGQPVPGTGRRASVGPALPGEERGHRRS